MHNMFASKISKNQAKDTGMAMVFILLFLGLYFKNFVCLKFAIAGLIITMLFPMAYKHVAIVWLGFSKLVGIISSKIILSVVFFCVVVPVAIFRKLLGKDVMKLKQFKRNTSSVMKTRNLIFSKEHLDKPY